MAESGSPRTRMTHGYRRWSAVIGTRLCHQQRLRPLPTPSSVPCAPGHTRTRIRPSGDNRRVLRARWIRLTGLALGLIAAGAAPASAAPLGLEDCGPAAGLYRCDGLVKTWDGIP